jgi:hypothetical protein
METRKGSHKFVALGLSLGLILAVSLIGFAHAQSTTKSLSTNYTLINLGSSTATVNVAYYKDDATSWTAAPANTNFTITANGGQAIVYQYFDATMSSGKGSAVVSSDQPLGALVQIVARPPQANSFDAYVGTSQPSSSYYIPLVARRASTASGTANSQIIIQNADTTSVDVTVQLTPRTGFTGSVTKNFNGVQPGVAVTYDIEQEAGLPTTPWFGSAIVTAAASKKISVVSNYFSGADGLQTITAFRAEDAAQNWSLPIFYSRLSNGLSSPVTIQNISGSDIAIGGIDVSCVASAGSTPATLDVSNTALVPNGQVFVINPVSDLSLPTAWQGSCEVVSSQNVVALVLPRFLPTAGNPNPGNNYSYNGAISSSTNKRVFVPLVAKTLTNGFATTIVIQNLSAITATATLTYSSSSSSPALLTATNVSIPPKGSLIHNHRLSSFYVNAPGDMPANWTGSLVVSADQPIAGIGTNTFIGAAALTGDTAAGYNLFSLP